MRSGLALWNAALDKTDAGAADDALQRMLSTYSAEVEIDFSRTTPDFPPLRGAEALSVMRQWIEGAREVFVSGRFEALDLIAAGDSVLVPVRVTAEGVNGVTTQMTMAYAFRIQQGQIASAVSFTSLGDARRAVGLE